MVTTRWATLSTPRYLEPHIDSVSIAAKLVAVQPPAGLIPFTSARKLMASFHRSDKGIVAYAKGAPRQIMERCDRGPDGEPLDDDRRRAVRLSTKCLPGRACACWPSRGDR